MESTSNILPIWKLISQKDYELRIELADFKGSTAYAQYTKLAGPIQKYQLTIGGYSGDAGHITKRPDKSTTRKLRRKCRA